MNKSSGRPKAHTTTISAVADGRFESNSEVRARNWAVRFTPQEQTSSARPVWSESANNRLMRRSKRHLYSITSSVRASSIGTRGELGDAFPLLEEHAVYKHDDRLHMLVILRRQNG